ncbi:MAG: HslU--HslV peptidase ATPase subunit, partial [Gammaproteobacteria bacterium]
SLTEQYQALLETEGLRIEFDEGGLRRIAETAWRVNEKTENIGARRLHTVMERLLDEASFTAADAGLSDEVLLIDTEYVDKQLKELSEDEDLSRFIL